MTRPGRCVCGVALEVHFDRRNRRLSCDEARRRAVLEDARTIFIGPGECVECRRGHHDRCSRTKGYDCECKCPRRDVGPRLRLVKSDRREVRR